MHGRPLSHLILLARHQSQARETCFRVRFVASGVSATLPPKPRDRVGIVVVSGIGLGEE